MSILDDVTDTLVNTGKEVAEKARDVSEQARISLEIKTKQDTLKKAYAEIGQRYYEVHKNDENPEYEEIEVVTELLETIAELQEQKKKKKAPRMCPACGIQVKDDDLYCRKCGAKVD